MGLSRAMTAWELYDQGPVEVASNGYTDVEDAPLEGLDDVIIEMPYVDFTLEYPFTRSYDGVVDGGPDGITLRQIIDAVRRGFREMYRAASHQPIARLMNERVEGAYGTAFHAIGDLVIEGIVFHEEEGRLEILIGS